MAPTSSHPLFSVTARDSSLRRTRASNLRPRVERRSRLQVGLAVTGVLLGTMLQAVDGSIVNVAIPQIQQELGGSIVTVGWVVTGYALASLIAMPLSAGVAARTGMRGYFVG